MSDEVVLAVPQPTNDQVKTETVVTQSSPVLVKKGEGDTLAPTTTEAQDKTTEEQRAISAIWERTQSFIALTVIVVGMTINSAIIVTIIFFAKEVSVTQLALISICLQFINLTAGIVMGFYFSRTNHARGIGPNLPEADYAGG